MGKSAGAQLSADGVEGRRFCQRLGLMSRHDDLASINKQDAVAKHLIDLAQRLDVDVGPTIDDKDVGKLTRCDAA